MRRRGRAGRRRRGLRDVRSLGPVLPAGDSADRVVDPDPAVRRHDQLGQPVDRGVPRRRPGRDGARQARAVRGRRPDAGHPVDERPGPAGAGRGRRRRERAAGAGPRRDRPDGRNVLDHIIEHVVEHVVGDH